MCGCAEPDREEDGKKAGSQEREKEERFIKSRRHKTVKVRGIKVKKVWSEDRNAEVEGGKRITASPWLLQTFFPEAFNFCLLLSPPC